MEQPSSYPLSVSALAPPLSHSTVAAVSSAEPIASVASSRVGREGEWRPADTARRVELERENGGGGRLIQDKSSNYKPTVDLPTRANMTTHIATMPTTVSTIVTSTSETTTATSTSPESIESSPLPAPNRPLSLDHLWKSANRDERRSNSVSSDSCGRKDQDDKRWEREREQKLALRKVREKEEEERVRRELQSLQHDSPLF